MHERQDLQKNDAKVLTEKICFEESIRCAHLMLMSLNGALLRDMDGGFVCVLRVFKWQWSCISVESRLTTRYICHFSLFQLRIAQSVNQLTKTHEMLCSLLLDAQSTKMNTRMQLVSQTKRVDLIYFFGYL